MRAVLIATDYLKDIDNTFKLIETNTGTHFVVKNMSNHINIDEFDTFLQENNIDTIELIKPKNRFDDVFDLDEERTYYEFSTDSIEGFFNSHYSGSSITFNFHSTEFGAVTIPQIEDAPNKLILRISYDGTALIDDTYARDNWALLKLMHDSYPTTIPATYINDTELGFDSIGTTIRDNNGFPNFIIKQRFPTTDYKTYPKVLKIDNEEQLETIKNSLLNEEYLQEYIYNPTDVIEGKLKTYRTITMIYGGNLDTLNFMSPYVHTNATAPSNTVDYDEFGFIQIWEKPSFLQKMGASKIKTTYHFDQNSKILLDNGSFVNIGDISVGSGVKTLDIAGLPSDTDEIRTWSENYETITGNTNIITTFVEQSKQITTSEWLINVTLEDNIKFSDVYNSTILLESKTDVNKVKFMDFQYIEVGDNFILYDLSTQTYIKKRVDVVEYSYEMLTIYTVDVEPQDAFLTTEEGVDTPRYMILQHNFGDCNAWCCTSAKGGYQACFNSGSYPDGYCSFSGYYEYCATSSPDYDCNACASACVECGGANK